MNFARIGALPFTAPFEILNKTTNVTPWLKQKALDLDNHYGKPVQSAVAGYKLRNYIAPALKTSVNPQTGNIDGNFDTAGFVNKSVPKIWHDFKKPIVNTIKSGWNEFTSNPGTFVSHHPYSTGAAGLGVGIPALMLASSLFGGKSANEPVQVTINNSGPVHPNYGVNTFKKDESY